MVKVVLVLIQMMVVTIVKVRIVVMVMMVPTVTIGAEDVDGGEPTYGNEYIGHNEDDDCYVAVGNDRIIRTDLTKIKFHHVVVRLLR